MTAEISCRSMRVAELRGILLQRISRILALAVRAQEAFLDEEDDVGLACLRQHWKAERTGISPAASELAALRRAMGADP